MSQATPTALVILAKAPVAGFAKTRLIPALGAQGAAALALKLLEHAVYVGAQTGFDHLELCGTPDAGHADFVRLANTHRLALSTQGDGDLGARMQRAFERLLARHGRVLLIGTDAPSLDAGMLREAAAALTTHDAVFVPALDGGYALVGLTKPAPALFEGMRWSHAQVMAETRVRARTAGLTWAELAAVSDIDEPTDLAQLPPGWVVKGVGAGTA